MIGEFRERLLEANVRFVLENVPGAARFMRHPIVLSGGMFGLGVERCRLFECSFPVAQPQFVKVDNPVAVYGARPDGRSVGKFGQKVANSLQEGREAMGIDWMSWAELTEAVPPAYTAFLAGQLLCPPEGDDVCAWCASPYTKTTGWQKFCCPKHRQAAFQHTNRLL